MSHDAIATTRTAPPGTCKLIGCAGWGQHAPHGIGVPDDFTPYQPTTCLGTPLVTSPYGTLTAACSISATSWTVQLAQPLTPSGMAGLVDIHKRDCRNRDAVTCG